MSTWARAAGFVLLALMVGHAAAGAQSVRSNTWTARSSTGLTFAGTWTVSPGPTQASVKGTWTLDDANGRTIRRGSWSAAKSPQGWTGAWRATVAGGANEYSGTWTAVVDLKADAQFADLFAKAVESVIRGEWRAGRQSGTWAIRAMK
jgi:hypothetical protein